MSWAICGPRLELQRTVNTRVVSIARRIVRRTYERLLAPMGARAVEQMLRDGLPPRLAPALRFLFDGHAPASAEEAALQIERLREQIAARPDAYRLAQLE